MWGLRSTIRLCGSLGSRAIINRTSPVTGLNALSYGTTTSEPGVQRSPYKDVNIPDNVNLAHYMMEEFPKFGDKPALVDGPTGRTITYAQLPVMVRRAASALVRMGLGRGDVVTIFLPNLPEFAVLYLATVAMGGSVSCLNPLYTPNELKHALELSKSKVVISIPLLAPVVKAAIEGNPNIKGLISIGEVEGFRPITDLLTDDGSLCPDSPTQDPMAEVAALPFSSGTTGLPKAVQLSHYNIVANVQQTSCSEEMITYDPDKDCLVGLLPFFHIFGQSCVLLGGLRNGVKVVTLPKFEPETFLQAMQGHRVTTAHVAPPICLFLAKHPYVEMFNLKHMHTMVSGAAPAPEAVVNDMIDRLKIKDFAFRQAYGMTESSPATHCNPKKNFKISSCGFAVHNTEFKIVDVKTGSPLGEGEEGELWVRGPQVMLGYLDNPEATAETVDQEGWLHTGDLAHYDSDGHVYVTDRLKELIKHKGFQVAPAELEAVLLTHPAVGDAGVVGVPDIRTGELPRAFVVLKPATKATEEEIQNYVKGKVAVFKELSGGVEFRAEIPKNLSGKILRRQLKEEYLATLT